MSLNFLAKAGIVSNEGAVTLSPEELAFQQEELRQEEVEISAIRSEIQTSANAIEHVLSAVDVATGLGANGVSANLTQAVFGEHLVAAGVPEDVAEVRIAGLESEGEEIGNEAFDTAKDVIKDIIAWVVEKWKDLKALLKRTFAKYFSSVKRATDAWRKLKDRTEKYQDDGYVLDDKTKLDVKSGCASFVLGIADEENPKDVVVWSKLPEEVGKFEKIATALEDHLSDDDSYEFPESLAELSNFPVAGVYSWLGKSFKSSGKTGTFSIGGNNSGLGLGLLGRQTFIRNLRDNTLSHTTMGTESNIRKNTKYINALSLSIRPSNIKLKSIEEVKVEVASLDEIDALADAHIEVGTKILTIQTDKNLRKLEKAFDKAIESTKKWSSEADSDDAEERRKATAGASLGVAILNLKQDATLGLVNDLVRAYATVSKAHGSVASKCLSKYKAA